MSKFWQQLVNIWSRLEVAQRATIILAGLGLFALVISLTYTATRPDWRTLASGLSKAKAQEIAAYLEEARVTHQVTDNGSSILVQSADLYKVGNDLAQKEMLTDGSKGFELLGKPGGMWQSTFSEHKTYDRALSGELERFFKELPGVRNARVLVDRPQPSPFLGDNDAKPKASVKLDMNPGMRLSDRQLMGVIHLCAGAVAGLSPDRVEVMDQSGLLTGKHADAGASQANTTLEAEVARELHLTRKAQEQLDAIFGPGKAHVKVSVKLDFTKRTESSSDPTTKVALEEHTTTSDEKGESTNSSGVAGTQPNVEGEQRTASNEPLKNSKNREEATTKYVVGTRKISKEDEIGRLVGMNVSILVPSLRVMKPVLGPDGKETAEKREVVEERPVADQNRIKDLVLNAIGFNAAKDLAAKLENGVNMDSRFTSAVQSMELFREEVPIQAGIPLPLSTTIPYGEAIGYVLSALVALAIILVARGQLKRSHMAWEMAEQRSREQHAVEEAQEEAQKPKVVEMSEEEKERAALKGRRLELKESIRRKIDEDPLVATQIVRRWMYE